MARTLFSWIHLSDIHFGHGAPSDRYDQKMVLERLRRDLDDARSEDKGPPQKPDAILVTGDIAFSGGGRDPKEYTDATAWLLRVAGQVGLGAGAVFVVPGNHDVNRGKDKDRNTARLVNALRGGVDELDTALADAGDRKLLEDRMRGYLDFATAFAPACLQDKPEGQPFWVHRFVKNGLTVRLAGLDTALLCAGDDDEGKLRLGKQQLHDAFVEPPGKGEVVIALSHHPLGWLAPADSRSAGDWIRGNVHVHLSGHVHEAQSEEVRGGGARGGMVRVVAGASHNERQPESWIPAGHGYNWAALVADDAGDVTLRVWPRRWSDGTTDFRLDNALVPRGKTWAEHPLPVELSKPRPPKLPGFDRAAAPAGIELFYFYSSEDEEERKKLHKHLASLWNVRKLISCSSAQSVAESGEDLAAVIERARVFLVLLSDAFLASDEFNGPELARALERSQDPSVKIIPIYLRPCDIKEHPIWGLRGGRTGLPDMTSARVIKSEELNWVLGDGDADAKLKNVSEGVRKEVEGLLKS
jgi:predicted MPP superfamily phosphohydrolase